MKKIKISGNKTSRYNRLSMGLMVLGIVCTLWALINIWDYNNYSASEEYVIENVNGTPDYFHSLPAPYKTLFPMDILKNFAIKPELSPIPIVLLPSEGDRIGKLTIPALDQVLPIIQGTGKNELKEGVGHFTQSVLPGEEDNCVLSGHRDTVFSQLGELVVGDQFIVETSAGIFTYEIQQIRIVDKDDKTVIVPTDHGVLTVTTCYPFNFIGSAPDRYILSADLVTGS